jgi:hypothetical protein
MQNLILSGKQPLQTCQLLRVRLSTLDHVITEAIDPEDVD